MTRISEILESATQQLRAVGIDSARLDARLLLSHAAARPIWPHETQPLTPEVEAVFATLLARRLDREPVSRILGSRGFWTLDLTISEETLDPRPDSETLIETAQGLFGSGSPPDRILDLGTGSGCLLLAALVAFPGATGLGIDRAPGAVATARGNATRNGLADRARFQTTDWDSLDPGCDRLILCNPPYIPRADIDGLDPEVSRFDPRLALDGGADGLDAYRGLAKVLPRRLAPDGVAILELGVEQGDPVSAIMEVAGLREIARRPDLGGIDRAIVLVWKNTLAF